MPRMRERDLRMVAFNDPELDEDQLRDLLDVQGAVGWVVGWSHAIGVEVDGILFVERHLFEDEATRDELVEELQAEFRAVRLKFTLRPAPGGRRFLWDDEVLHFYDLGWEPQCITGMEIEFRSPERASWRPHDDK